MTFHFAAKLLLPVRTLAAPLMVVAALCAGSALAQEEVTPDTVVATVGGEAITEADLAFAAEDMAAELQSIPVSERRAFLVTVMIDMKVMANAARDAGLDQTDIFARRLDYLEERSLRRAYFSEVIEGAVTQDAINTAYEDFVSGFEAQLEVRARHILVPTLEEAETIRAEIEGGLSFEEAAAEYGTDGTRATGGDLGYFSSGMMVQPFEEGAFALEVGELSQPIETQFGFHLIKLEDRRVTSAPTIEQVGAQLAQQLLYDNFSSIVGDLKADTTIDIPDAELAAAVEAQGGL